MSVITTVEGDDGETEAEYWWLDAAADEPEIVGVYDHTEAETCEAYDGDPDETPERCENPATHTLVAWMDTRETTARQAVCDDHGYPDMAGKSPFERVGGPTDDDGATPHPEDANE